MDLLSVPASKLKIRIRLQHMLTNFVTKVIYYIQNYLVAHFERLLALTNWYMWRIRIRIKA